MVEIRELYHGRLISFQLENTTLPNGASMTLEVVRHPGAAAVVPVDEQGQVILVRQFRPVVGDFILELPAGKLDPGEDAAASARRELREEVGIEPGEMAFLATILTAPGYSDERVSLFLAQHLVIGTTQHEPDEVMSTYRIPFSKAIELVHKGEIRDAKTAIGLLLAQARVSVS